MNLKTLTHQFNSPYSLSQTLNRTFISPNHQNLQINNRTSRRIFIKSCFSSNAESVAKTEIEPIEKIETVESVVEEFSEKDSLVRQTIEIVKFSRPVVGLWICGSLMSSIATAVIGQCSSIELAALGAESERAYQGGPLEQNVHLQKEVHLSRMFTFKIHSI